MTKDTFIGIDLGTSNSVVSYVKEGKAHVVEDAEGRRVHPSVVSFLPDGYVWVGAAARDRFLVDGTNTVFSIKRLIGRRFGDQTVKQLRERVPFDIQEGDDGLPRIATRKGVLSLSQMSAYILGYLKRLAETELGTPVERAVITVPANFNNLQREATKQAGGLAGFKTVRILNEPTAAALAYGFGKGLRQRIAVFDLGGGTLDITILNIHDNVFEVLSTAGDTALGGDDVDVRLAELMAMACLKTNNYDVRRDRAAMAKLRRFAERLKVRLSEEESVVMDVPQVATDDHGKAIDLTVSLDRAGLDQRIADLVDRCLKVFDDALKLAGAATPELLDHVLLVGGSTRIPLVLERLTDYLGKPPRQDIDPMEAVALGAAVHAASLGLAADDVTTPRSTLLDVTPRALGIGIVGNITEPIIARNTTVPVEQTRVFTTSYDNQTVVRIPICQGESRQLVDNTSLGMLELGGIPARPRGAVHVAVTFEINTDGILEVHAIDRHTGKKQSVRIVLGATDAHTDAG
jgi:molecular chaperone DnaK